MEATFLVLAVAFLLVFVATVWLLAAAAFAWICGPK